MLIAPQLQYVLADIEVARAADFGHNDAVFVTRTHLGGFLQPGDSCMGYDLTHLNANNDHFDALREERIPYCVIVKKHYPNRRRIQNRRKWKLQQLAKIQDGGISKKDEDKTANDYEAFMRDLEEDPELRANINIYRDETVPVDMPVPRVTDDGELVEEDFPEISLDEMLNALSLDDHDPGLAAEQQAVGQQMEQFAVRDMVDEMAMEH